MLEFDFDLQRFDDDDIGADANAEPSTEDAQDIPEELSGLPEDIARETLEEWESTQAEQSESSETSEMTQTEDKPGAVPYDRFKEKVDEANRLKAQLAEYQRQFQAQQQAPQAQQQPRPQPQAPRQPSIKLTPEISKQINKAIEEEALSISGLTKKDLEDIQYADNDDPRVSQWSQAKAFATSNVIGAIRQAQAAQQQQAQAFLANHAAAVQSYNEFAAREFAEPDFKEIQNFATNEFFLQLKPYDQQVLANSYLRVERQIASPAEMMVVQNYFNQAKAAYRARSKGSKRTTQPQRKAATLPRTDQIRGTAAVNDGQLSDRDIERMLEGDFTEISPQQQKVLLALS